MVSAEKEGDPIKTDLFICDPSTNDSGLICGWKRGELMKSQNLFFRACGRADFFEGAQPRPACGYRGVEPGCFLKPGSTNSN